MNYMFYILKIFLMSSERTTQKIKQKTTKYISIYKNQKHSYSWNRDTSVNFLKNELNFFSVLTLSQRYILQFPGTSSARNFIDSIKSMIASK